jgi:hypothetical protein
MSDKKNFWWWGEKDKTYTAEEIRDLLDRVNDFNCGAIDDYLTKHVDKVFDEWLKEKE